MTLLPPGVKVHLALGYVDMRKGIDGLAMLVQGLLRQDPFTGHLLYSGAAPEPTSSRSYSGTGLGCVSSRNGLSMASSYGRQASNPARRYR